MPSLVHVPASHIDKAWRDGAHQLSKACETSETTPDQLKLLLSRGERMLLAIMDQGPVGWLTASVQQFPNIRALHVGEIYAPGAMFEECWHQLVQMAYDAGCSEIRCSAKDTQARLYRMRFGFQPIYTVCKVRI